MLKYDENKLEFSGRYSRLKVRVLRVKPFASAGKVYIEKLYIRKRSIRRIAEIQS